MTFKQWLNETENFSTREERMYSELNMEDVMLGNLSHNLAQKRIYAWMHAAYCAGYEAGKNEKS